jgi:prepilin-type N-terminal cleavage/methylation domain-containing protein
MLNSKTFSSKRASKRSAFTLIELSIVLIIIGLLVAGVTGGASLIRSAQLRSVMSEARGYNVAVNAFVVQYNELPGDYGVVIGSSEKGNQNDQINYIDMTSDDKVIYEGVNAWSHLQGSGTIDESLTIPKDVLTPKVPNALTIGTHIPDSQFDGLGWVFDYAGTKIGPTYSAGYLQEDSVGYIEDRNVVIATGPLKTLDSNKLADDLTEEGHKHVEAVGAMTPTDALSIDAKLDDGDPANGRVRVPELLINYKEGDTTLCANDTDSDSGTRDDITYNTAKTGNECALEFTVDIS